MSRRHQAGSGCGRAGSIRHLAVVLCLAAVALQTGACRSRRSEETPTGTDTRTGADTERLAGDEDATSLELYFPDANDRLQRESREIAPTEDAADRIRLLIEALIAGPTGDDLFAPLPPEVELAAVQVSAGGIAYLDFEAPENSGPPPSGTRAEIATLYSIVDSVVLNVAEVQTVVLLWNGRQRFSFAGHLDTSAPLRANLDLVVGER